MKLKIILKTMIVLIGMTATQYTFGQQGSVIDSLKIIPINPTTSDEIELIVYTTFQTGDCDLNTPAITFDGNEISVMLNYTVGDYTAICHSVDTVSIGNLDPGDYDLTALLTVNLLEAIFDSDTIGFAVGNVLSVSGLSVGNEVGVYPNPFHTELTIKSSNGVDLRYVEIYSLLGEKVFRKEISSNSPIDASHLPAGLYIAVLTDKSGIQHIVKTMKVSR